MPAAVLLVLAWAGPYPHPSFLRDSSTWVYGAQVILAGGIPFRDFWGNPEASTYINAVALAFGKPVLPTLFFLDIAYSLLVLAAAAWALSRVVSPWIGAAALVWMVLLFREPAIFQGGNLTEQHALLPVFLSAGCALRSLTANGRSLLVWAGLCGFFTGLALLCRESWVSIAPALLVGNALRSPGLSLRDWLRLTAVAAAAAALPVLALVAAYLVIGVTPGQLWDQGPVYDSLYEVPPGRHLLRLAWQSLQRHPELLAIPAALLLRLLAELFARRARRWWPPGPVAAFLLTMLAFDIYQWGRPGYFYGHYYMMLVASTTLLGAWALEGAAQAVPAATAVLRPVLAVASAAALMAFAFPTATTESPNGLRALLAGRTIPTPALQTAVLDEIARRCPAGAPMLVWGYEPRLYDLSGHRAASTYFYLFPLEMAGYQNAAKVGDLTRQVESAQPCVIVYPLWDQDSVIHSLYPPLEASERLGWVNPQAGDQRQAYQDFSPLYPYVAAHYRREVVGRYEVYVRRT